MTKKTNAIIIIGITLLLLMACSSGKGQISTPEIAKKVETPTPEVEKGVVTLEIVTSTPEVENTEQIDSPQPEEPTATLPALTSTAVVISSDGQIALKHLKALSEEIDARMPGLAGEVEAAGYIQEKLTALGYAPQVQKFTFTDGEGNRLYSANVMAVKAGDSPKEIVVGAHYDSADDAQGAGAQGADDNASGVAVMLEAAEIIKDLKTPYTIRFIAFGSEENDLNGSRYYVDQMDEAARDNTLAMINLDSLIAGDIAYVYGDGSLWEWIIQFADSEDLSLESKTAAELENPDGTPCDCADYNPFEAAGIPFAYFEATNWELGKGDGMIQVDEQYGDGGEIRHTQYDTLEYIEQTFPGRALERLSLFVTLLANSLTRYH